MMRRIKKIARYFSFYFVALESWNALCACEVMPFSLQAGMIELVQGAIHMSFNEGIPRPTWQQVHDSLRAFFTIYNEALSKEADRQFQEALARETKVPQLVCGTDAKWGGLDAGQDIFYRVIPTLWDRLLPQPR